MIRFRNGSLVFKEWGTKEFIVVLEDMTDKQIEVTEKVINKWLDDGMCMSNANLNTVVQIIMEASSNQERWNND
jgi:hypothetical protein